MKITVDSVGYILDKPGVSEGSCEGCIAQVDDIGLCMDIRACSSSICLEINLVWRKVDTNAAKDTKK